jgi:signal peptidase I
MQAAEQPKSNVRSALREVIETVVLTLLIYFLVRHFLLENYRVLGMSMTPTLENGQFLVVYKLGYRLHEPERGDIIVFRDPAGSDRKLIKRVIGLPGEVVEIQEGQVFINQQPLDEPYIQSSAEYTLPPTPIPADQYFVLGDNRNNSSDSHYWGALPSDNIVGRAWFAYWPPSKWGLVSHPVYGNEP